MKQVRKKKTFDTPPSYPQNLAAPMNPYTYTVNPWTQLQTYTPVMVLLLIIAAFFLGILVDRTDILSTVFNRNNLTQYPANTGDTQQTQGSAKGPLHLAKAIGLNANTFKKCLDSGKYTQTVANDLSDGQKAGVTGTPATFVNGLILVGAQPYSAFKIMIDQELATSVKPFDISSLMNKAYAQIPDTATPTPPARVPVDVGKFPLLGNQNAKVTVVEFADFQCPFCKQFYTTVEPSLMNEYVKTGKVKLAFRNYAFLGQESNTSAEGAYCANDQGKFWAYHNFMYEHQGQENSGTFTKDNLEN